MVPHSRQTERKAQNPVFAASKLPLLVSQLQPGSKHYKSREAAATILLFRLECYCNFGGNEIVIRFLIKAKREKLDSCSCEGTQHHSQTRV